MDIAWIPNNNFFPNSGKKTKVVLHGTAGGSSASGIANYFKSTEGTDHPASTHYIVDQQGTIVQTVKEKDGAWGNGVVTNPKYSGENPNNYTISIEFVKKSTDNSDELTGPQTSSGFLLIADILKRNGLTYNDIISHADIDPVNRARCPGPFPHSALKSFIEGKKPLPEHTTPGVHQKIAFDKRWDSRKTIDGTHPKGSGIYNSALHDYINGVFHGPPMSAEYDSVDWSGKFIVVQEFAYGWCEYYDGTAHWYPGKV